VARICYVPDALPYLISSVKTLKVPLICPTENNYSKVPEGRNHV